MTEEQTAEKDAGLRTEIAEVVYRELGDMVNRDYLIDALMPVVAEACAHALILAAQFIEYDMAKAWGGTTAWFSTGNKVADVVADVLRERADTYVNPPGVDQS